MKTTVKPRLYVYDEGEAYYLRLKHADFYRSEFPNENITLDLDKEDNLIGVELIGSAAQALKEYYESQ